MKCPTCGTVIYTIPGENAGDNDRIFIIPQKEEKDGSDH